MLTSYLIIPILLGVSVWESIEQKQPNSAVNLTDLDAMRLAKSESIRKYMNETIDPCVDFYQFACGNWRKHHPATVDETKTQGLYFAVDDFNRILVPILNEADVKYTDSEWKVKNYFDSCLNLSSFKVSEYRQKMKKLIKEFGRMPALEGNKWQHNKFDWIKTIGEISFKYNIGIIYGYSLINTNSDPTAKELVMKSQLLFQFPDTSAGAIKQHRSNVKENLKQLIGVNSKTAKQTAKEIVDFALKLWKANEQEVDKSLTTFKEMHRKYLRRLNVMKLVKACFGYIPDGIVVDENPGYVKALAKIVKKTPKRVLANYIFYTLMLEFQSYQPSDAFLSAVCLESAKTYFLPILSNMAYRRSSPQLNEKEEEILRMWQGIITTLQNTLESNQLSWFDDNSREAALEKLYLMKVYIASYGDVKFDELYKELTLNSSDLMENKKSIKSFDAKQTRKSLNERRDNKKNAIGDFSPSYSTTANAVRFPLSILLTDHMWSKYDPQALNYGRLGFITAHELMHGFSGAGRYFDRLGIYIDWIYKDIRERYEERRQCYYDQYHNFTLDNKPMHQHYGQGENIADNGGTYLAYHTYLRWLADEARTKEEMDMETLPHLNYTNKQLYFIGYTQFWCSDTHPVAHVERTSDDQHSPHEFRGFVPLLNFGEFAKEFNCRSGSPMNPRKKCSIY